MGRRLKSIKKSRSDRALNAATVVLLAFVLLAVGYPLVYVISASFSSSKALAAG